MSAPNTNAEQLKNMRAIQKRKTAHSKGIPPSAAPTTDLFGDDGQPSAPEQTVPIQFRVPKSVQERFNNLAGLHHGWAKGAKSLLFLAMFEDYERRCGEPEK